MNAVAADTADLRLGVGRAVEVRVRSCVTGQAHGVNLFGRVLRGIEYLARVAAARHVLRAGTVAAFAALMGGSSFGIECGLPVRRLLPAVVEIFVARLTGLRPHVLGRFRGGRSGHWWVIGLNALSRRLRSGLAQSKGEARKD